MKKILSFIIIIISTLNFLAVNTFAAGPEITAPSAVLIEKTTGKVLYEKNSNEKMKPASVTKIMTILLIMEAIERGEFGYDDIVTVSAYATSMGGSQVYLKEGEQMTVHEMLKCIVIASANDACVAMAEFVSGTVDSFVASMNKRAEELNMTDTHFVNCTGLDADGHLTTAHDISIMSKELLKHDKIKEYTTIWMDSIRGGEFGLTNTNKLIRFYKYATGLKTGYTKESMYCISATAEQNGMELIAVIMAAPSSDERSADAKKLFNFGFSEYSLYKPEDIQIPEVKVLKGKEDKIIPVAPELSGTIINKGTENDIKVKIDICEDVLAPVEKNQKLGTIYLMKNNETIASTDITSPVSIRKSGVFEIFLDLIQQFLIV